MCLFITDNADDDNRNNGEHQKPGKKCSPKPPLKCIFLSNTANILILVCHLQFPFKGYKLDKFGNSYNSPCSGPCLFPVRAILTGTYITFLSDVLFNSLII